MAKIFTRDELFNDQAAAPQSDSAPQKKVFTREELFGSSSPKAPARKTFSSKELFGDTPSANIKPVSEVQRPSVEINAPKLISETLRGNSEIPSVGVGTKSPVSDMSYELNADTFKGKLKEIVQTPANTLAGIGGGTLGVSESLYRTPEMVGRGINSIGETLSTVTGNQKIKSTIEKYNAFDPQTGTITRGSTILGKKFSGTSDVADSVHLANEILPDLLPAFQRNQKLSQDFEDGFEELLSTGRSKKLLDTVLNPSAWGGVIGQAVPSMATALASGGSTAFIAWLEAAGSANDIADFEKRTGGIVSGSNSVKSMSQALFINAWFEKAGLAPYLEKLKKKTLPAVKTLGKKIYDLAKNALKEGTTEAIQEFNTNLASMNYDKTLTLQDLRKGMASSFIGGFGSGMAMDIASDIVMKGPSKKTVSKAELESKGEITPVPPSSEVLNKPSQQIATDEDFSALVEQAKKEVNGPVKTEAVVEAEKVGKVIGIDAETKLPIIDTKKTSDSQELKSGQAVIVKRPSIEKDGGKSPPVFEEGELVSQDQENIIIKRRGTEEITVFSKKDGYSVVSGEIVKKSEQTPEGFNATEAIAQIDRQLETIRANAKTANKKSEINKAASQIKELEKQKAYIEKTGKEYVETAKARKPLDRKNAKTLIGLVRADGGIDPDSLTAAGYNLNEDFKQFGLGFVLKKGGNKADSYANELANGGGYLQVRPNEEPLAALVRGLQQKAKLFVDQKEEEYDAEYEEWAKAKSERANGFTDAEIESANREAEKQLTPDIAQESKDQVDKGEVEQEIGDISFDTDELEKSDETQPSASAQEAGKPAEDLTLESEKAPAKNLDLKFEGRFYPVASKEEAAELWNKVRDEAIQTGLDPSNMKEAPFITDSTGKTIAHITWNGTVKDGPAIVENDSQSLIPGTEKPTYRKPKFGEARVIPDQKTEATDLQAAANEGNQGRLLGDTNGYSEEEIKQFLSDNKERIKKEYIRDNGKIINNDLMKKYFSEVGYDGTNSRKYQKSAGEITKELFFEELVKLPKGSDVVFTTGGTGAGKSTAFTDKAKDEFPLVWDLNLTNFEQNKKLIQDVIASGHTPNIAYVLRDPQAAFFDGVLARYRNPESSDYGRVVTIDEHMITHKKAKETFDDLLNYFGDKAKYSIRDNRGNPGQDFEMDLADFKNVKYDYNKIRQEIINELESRKELRPKEKEDFRREVRGTVEILTRNGSGEYGIPRQRGENQFSLESGQRKEVSLSGKKTAAELIQSHPGKLISLRAGAITAKELADYVQELADREDEIKSELSQKSIKELTGRSSVSGYDKKRIVSSVYNSMLSNMVGTVSYQLFGGETFKSAAVKQAKEITDQEIQEHAEEIRQNLAKNKKALENPETYEEFSYFVSRKGADALTAEQKIKWDDLQSEMQSGIRAREESKKEVVKGVSLENTEFSLSEEKHSKTGEDLFVVKMNNRVSSEQFKELAQKARMLGGNYSRFSRGFLFRDKGKAEKFMALKEGDVSRKEDIDARRGEVKDNAVDRLRSMADSMEADANDSLNQDRRTNTHRQLSMAQGAEAQAQADIALAKTMRKIADAIEAGKAKRLEGLRTRAQVEELLNILARSKQKTIRLKNDGKMPQNEVGRPIELTDIENAEWPTPGIHFSTLRDLISEMGKAQGYINDAKKAQKLYDVYAKKDSAWIPLPKERYGVRDSIINLAKGAAKRKSWAGKRLMEELQPEKRLEAMDINTLPELRSALRELFAIKVDKVASDSIKTEEAELRLKQGGDFYTTPERVVETLLDAADISSGESVLEPSAGLGNIAQAIKESSPGADLTVNEYDPSRATFLKKKGFSKVENEDFLEMQGGYDKIVMNPPFSMEKEHVRKAYEMLKPGGRLVSVMSSGPFFRSFKADKDFRDWFDSLGGEKTDLEQGAFKESGTGVNTVMVVLDKPESVFGSENKLVNQSEFEAAKKEFKDKTGGLRSGIDPTAIKSLVKIGTYYFEGGARSFAAWSKKMIDEIGEKVRPYLQQIWDDIQKSQKSIEQYTGGSQDQNGMEYVSGFEKITENHPVRALAAKKQVNWGEALAGKITREEAREKNRNLTIEIVKAAEKSGIALKVNLDGSRTPAVRQKSGIFAEKEFGEFGFRDYGGLTDNLTSWAATVDNIQEGKGFGPAYNLAAKIYSKIADRNEFISKYASQIHDIIKKHGLLSGPFSLPSKLDGEIVFEILDGKDPVDAKPGHIAATKEIRVILDELRIGANAVRKALGKPEIGYLENYAPHIQKTSIWIDLFTDPRTTLSDTMDFIIPNERSNPHAKQRYGNMKDKDKNAFHVLDSYIQAVASDIYLSPTIEKIKAVNSVMRSRGMDKSSAFLDNYIRNNLLRKPATIDNAIGMKAGSKFRKGAAAIINARNIGALAGNIQWILLTQPASLGFTVMKAGPVNTAKSMINFLINPGLRKEVDSFTVTRLKTGLGVGTTGGGDLDKARTKIISSPIGKFNDFIAKLADAMEYYTTGVSVAAGLEKGRDYGLTGNDLRLFADYVAQVTQSMYNAESRPQLLNSMAIRLAFPFQTFAFEAWRHVKTIRGAGGGLPLDKRQRAWQLMLLVISGMLLNWIHERMKGKELQTIGSFIPMIGPAVDEQIENVKGVVNKKMGGPAPKNYGGGRSPIAPLEEFRRIGEAVQVAIDTGDFTKVRKEIVFWSMGFAGIGGAGQVNRSVDGLIASEQGYADSASGKVLFPIVGPLEKTRAIIGGPYNTEAGRRYLGTNIKSDFEKKIESAKRGAAAGERESAIGRKRFVMRAIKSGLGPKEFVKSQPGRMKEKEYRDFVESYYKEKNKGSHDVVLREIAKSTSNNQKRAILREISDKYETDEDYKIYLRSLIRAKALSPETSILAMRERRMVRRSKP